VFTLNKMSEYVCQGKHHHHFKAIPSIKIYCPQCGAYADEVKKAVIIKGAVSGEDKNSLGNRPDKRFSW
jgi:hypothetical protein